MTEIAGHKDDKDSCVGCRGSEDAIAIRIRGKAQPSCEQEDETNHKSQASIGIGDKVQSESRSDQ